MLRAQLTIVNLAFGEVDAVATACAIHTQRFSSIDASGPASVALYRRLPLGNTAADEIQALAFARVVRLLRQPGPARP